MVTEGGKSNSPFYPLQMFIVLIHQNGETGVTSSDTNDTPNLRGR